MFAYCKNEPVDMSDPDGERPMYSGESASDVELSVTFASRMLTGRSIAKPVVSHSVSKSSSGGISTAESIALGAAASAGDTAVSYKVLNNLQKVKNVAVSCKELGPAFEMEGAVSRSWVPIVKAVGSKMGALSIAATGLSLSEDYASNNTWDSRLKSMGVDVAGALAGVIVGGVIGALGLTLAPAIAVGVMSAGIIGGLDYLAKKRLGVN
jgi:hypothetical protein